MRKFLFVLTGLISAFGMTLGMGVINPAQAQTANVGIGTITPHASAQLDVTSPGNNKGFLPPRMTAVQMKGIPNPSYGLTVFNVDDSCLYYYTGTTWRSSCRANVNAVFASNTINCTGALNGNYVATVATTSSNTKTVTVTVTTPGDYTITTDNQNGVTFAGAGTIQSVGAGTQITLTASGVPISSGTFTYTVTLSGQTCTFQVTYNTPPATIANGTVNCGTVSGTYSAGSATVASANTATITVVPTSAGFYNYSTSTVNGINFSASGTFTAAQVAAGQPVTVTLGATGTPVAAGTYSYTVTGTNVSTNCSFNVTVQQSKSFLVAAIDNPTNGTFQVLPANTDVLWVSTRANNGVVVNGAEITLLPNRTYRVTTKLRCLQTTPGFAFVNYILTNSSNAQYPGTTIGISYPTGNNSLFQTDVPATGIITTGATSQIVKVRVTAAASNVSVIGDNNGYSYIQVEELAPSATYIVGSLNQYQAGNGQPLTTGTDFAWQTQNIASGASLSGTNITLLANKTYLLRADLRTSGPNSPGNYVSYTWVNSSNSRLAGTAIGLAVPTLSTALQSSIPATGIYTTGSTNQTVKVRATMANGVLSANGDPAGHTSFIADEIPAGATYGAGSITSGSQALSNGTDLIWTQLASNGVTVSGTGITLKAGKAYRLVANIRAAMTGSYAFAAYQFVNSSNVQLPGTTVGIAFPTGNTTTALQNSVPASGIYRVGNTDEVIKVRVVSTAGTISVIGNTAGESSITAVEL
jgi:hypothetical protein